MVCFCFIGRSPGKGGKEERVAIGVQGLGIKDITLITMKRKESRISLLAVSENMRSPKRIPVGKS